MSYLKQIENDVEIKKFLQLIQKIMSSTKKKTQLATILDELRCEDPRKRLAAVMEIKDVAAAMGPARVRTELISFLAQFIDDEQNIVLELLSQLNDFSPLLGGPEHEKSLVPLLISFCKTDEKKIAFASCQLLQKIVQKNKDLALEVLKKLMKTDMKITKECGIQLISNLFPLLEAQEAALMELYSALFQADNPQYRIIASKYLQPILRNLKGKQQVSKHLEVIYSEGGELQKIFALEALVQFYEVNNNFSLTKFKHLSIINSWRVNIKICEISPKIADKVSKAHFKLIFEPTFLKFMISNEPELRSASCKALSSVAKHMTDDEMKNKLQPILKKLAGDSVDYVKVELANNIVPLCSIVNSQFMCQCLLPIILFFIKDSNSEIALGIIKNFQHLATKLNKDVLEEKIIKPLLQQLSTQNWRVKCQIIEILKEILTHQSFLSDAILKVFIGLTDDRIDAVRLKANELIIAIMCKNPKEWCEQYVIPKIFTPKENISYIKKQNLLHIIQKTAPFVSEKALKDIYQLTVVNCLNDKVPNVRVKSISVVKNTTKLNNPTIQKQIEKLREDKDQEVREFAKRLRA